MPAPSASRAMRRDEIIGRHFSQFYTPDDRSAGLPNRSLSIAAATGKFEAEAWRVRKDGSLFWANVVIDAIRDETGKLVGFAKITRDITERRNAQEALERAHQQLAQAQKMEALGQLTGGVAHDFNNLLMVVSGQAQALLRRLTDQKNARSLEAILAAASRGEALTRQLLTFARRQPLNPRTVDLGQTVAAFRDVLSSSARGNIRPAHRDPAGCLAGLDRHPRIRAGSGQSGGQRPRRHARGRHHQPDRRQCHAARQRNRSRPSRAISSRSPSAIPAPASRRKSFRKIFEPFFTTKRRRQGHRAWPVAGLWLRATIGRRHRRSQQARPRHASDSLSAAQPSAGRRRRCQ